MLVGGRADTQSESNPRGRILGEMEHIEIEVSGHVGRLWLNRPAKKNALSADMWADIPAALAELAGRDEVRVVIVAGRGDSLTVGIDLAMLMGLKAEGSSPADRNMQMYQQVKRLQSTMTAFEACPVPVIAAIHGYCLGAGIDLITACDIRLATADAVLGVRETLMGLIADVGTMQRLPKVISAGHAAELIYTGADIDGTEAARIGLVNRCFPDRSALETGAMALAEKIAANSPLVVQGIKAVLHAEAGMSTTAALDHIALWNTAFLESNDLGEALAAHLERRPPRYTGT
jgi:enoyl-CoA hydratase